MGQEKLNEEASDVGAYDTEKCFDLYDLYKAGLKNNKLTLLFEMNQSAQVAVKTAHGMTERVNIENIIMQGTTWGSLLCTATIDKCAKLVYSKEDL